MPRAGAIAIACAIAACAPAIDGPIERARAADLADGDRLALELAALPGVRAAHAILHRPARDPLTGDVQPASAAVLLVVDASVDRASVTAAAAALARGVAPMIDHPAIVVEPIPSPAAGAELVTVSPFEVARGSRGILIAALALGLALIAGLAVALALRYRGSSAQ